MKRAAPISRTLASAIARLERAVRARALLEMKDDALGENKLYREMQSRFAQELRAARDDLRRRINSEIHRED